MQFTRNFDKNLSSVEAQLHKRFRRYQRKGEAVPRFPTPSLPRLEPEIVCEKRKKKTLCIYKGKHRADMVQKIREWQRHHSGGASPLRRCIGSKRWRRIGPNLKCIRGHRQARVRYLPDCRRDEHPTEESAHLSECCSNNTRGGQPPSWNGTRPQHHLIFSWTNRFACGCIRNDWTDLAQKHHAPLAHPSCISVYDEPWH